MTLTLRAKAMSNKPDGIFEKMLDGKVISKRKYAELAELRDSWRSGEIAIGTTLLAADVSRFVRREIAPSTLRGWLGRKGSNVTQV